MTEIKREFLIERQGRSFVLYAGLLDLAHNQGLKDITTELVQIGCEENGQTWLFKAEVTVNLGHFTGYGDANPTNVSRQMLTVLPRMAETRAKARALRDAVNVGVAALEELGDEPPHDEGHEAITQGRTTVQPQPQRTAPPASPRAQAGPPTMPPPSQNQGNPNLATDAQVSAIYAIGKGLKKDRDAMDEWLYQRFTRSIDQLTRKEASDIITALKEQQGGTR